MPIPIRVLILEDRPEDAELMVYELRRSQFEPDWLRVDTESEYNAHLGWRPDLILSDYNMPLLDAPRALALLQELLRRFEESGVSRVFLEVRESNKGAMAFYERAGFQRAGRREGYYQDPREAALVFEKNEDSTRVVPNNP